MHRTSVRSTAPSFTTRAVAALCINVLLRGRYSSLYAGTPPFDHSLLSTLLKYADSFAMIGSEPCTWELHCIYGRRRHGILLISLQILRIVALLSSEYATITSAIHE